MASIRSEKVPRSELMGLAGLPEKGQLALLRSDEKVFLGIVAKDALFRPTHLLSGEEFKKIKQPKGKKPLVEYFEFSRGHLVDGTITKVKTRTRKTVTQKSVSEQSLGFLEKLVVFYDNVSALKTKKYKPRDYDLIAQYTAKGKPFTIGFVLRPEKGVVDVIFTHEFDSGTQQYVKVKPFHAFLPLSSFEKGSIKPIKITDKEL